MLLDAHRWIALGVGALVAPVAIWLVWLAQLHVVDALHRRTTFSLSARHVRLRDGVLFASTFIHEMSHMLVSILTGNGVSEFRVGDDGGHVQSSARESGPVRAIGRVLVSLAPLYVPPLFVVALFVVYFDQGLLSAAVQGPLAWESVPAALSAWGDLGEAMGRALATPRPAHPAWWLALAVALLAMPSARPSADIPTPRGLVGDLNNVRAMLRAHPAAFALVALLVVGSYALTQTRFAEAYWIGAQFVAAVAAAGVVLAVASALLWAVASRVLPRRPLGVAVCAAAGVAAYVLAPAYAPSFLADLGQLVVAIPVSLAVGLVLRIGGR